MKPRGKNIVNKIKVQARYQCKESYFRGVRIFGTAVYCLWAEKETQDGCHSLTWNPFSEK